MREATVFPERIAPSHTVIHPSALILALALCDKGLSLSIIHCEILKRFVLSKEFSCLNNTAITENPQPQKNNFTKGEVERRATIGLKLELAIMVGFLVVRSAKRKATLSEPSKIDAKGSNFVL